MPLLQTWGAGALLVGLAAIGLWLTSLALRNSSIVDVFWGLGFVALAWVYFALTPEGFPPRKWLISLLVTIWGLRLSLHILWRNWGKGEDFRYRRWREQAGASWWWRSYFQVFLLQGLLLWLISAPLLAAQASSAPRRLTLLDYAGTGIWAIGFLFEALGDWQLRRFRSHPDNQGKVLANGLWRYTRHPNYFGDAVLWWGYYLIAAAAGGYNVVFSPLLMSFLLVRVSGVAMLDKALLERKPGYREYTNTTRAFFPWFPARLPNHEITQPPDYETTRLPDYVTPRLRDYETAMTIYTPHSLADLANGSTLHYDAAGHGSAVILIHAGIADMRMWDDQFGPLSECFRVIRYDVRGYGQSPNPEGTYSDHEDLRSLCQYLGVEQASLVGVSNGGRIAIDFALAYPEWVDRLVVVGSSVGGFDDYGPELEGWQRDLKQAYETGDLEGTAEVTLRFWIDGPRRVAGQVDPVVRARVREMLLHMYQIPEEEDLGQNQPLMPPAFDRLHEIQAPTLVIVGEEDIPDKLRLGRLIAERVPNASLVTLPNAAHLPNMERPAEFNNLVLEFLGS